VSLVSYLGDFTASGFWYPEGHSGRNNKEGYGQIHFVRMSYILLGILLKKKEIKDAESQAEHATKKVGRS
jgi:hypothetical protein